MKVYRAETGALFEVEGATGATTGQQLRELVAAASGVPAAEQILILATGVSVRPSKPLDVYGLPSSSSDLFMYDRRSLAKPASAAAASSAAAIPPIPYVAPPPATAAATAAATAEAEQIPVVGPLVRFQRVFEEHRARAEAVQRVVDRRLAACRRAHAEIVAQGAAASAATAVLGEDMRRVALAFEAQREPTAKQLASQQSLLDTFPDAMESLRTTVLRREVAEWLATVSPSLASRPRLALIDLVPEDRLVSWAGECRTQQSELASTVAALRRDVDALLTDVDAFRKQQHQQQQAPSAGADDAKGLFEKIVNESREVEALLRDFTLDCTNIARSIESARQQTSQPPWGLEETFGEMKKVHEINIELLNQLESDTAFTLSQFSALKVRSTNRILESLRRVSELETRIQGLYKSMRTLQEMRRSQHEAFKQLVCARNMPAAYHAYEREIARRTEFADTVAEQIARYVDQLRAISDAERTLRDEFRKQYVRYLPKELQPGTASFPPLFNFVLPPFDTDIPKIADPKLAAAATAAVSAEKPADAAQDSALALGQSVSPMVSSGVAPVGSTAGVSTPEQPGTASLGSFAQFAMAASSQSASSSAQQAERDSLLKDLEASQRAIGDLEEQVASLKAAVEKTEKQRSELARAAEEGQRLLEQSTRRSQDETSTLQKRVEALEAQIATASAERDKQEKRLQDLNDAYAQMQRDHKASVAQLRELLSRSDEALARCHSELGERDAKEEVYKRQLETMQGETTMASVLRSQLAELQKSIRDKEEALTRLNAERAVLASELDRTKAALAETERAKSAIEHELDRVKAALAESEQAKHGFEHELEESISRFRKLEQDLQGLTTLTHSMLESTPAVVDGFHPGALAIFCHRSDLRGLVYEAVNRGCPNYFLGQESLDAFQEQTKRHVPVIATVVLITQHDAARGNPYDLPVGTPFFEVVAQACPNT